VGMTGDQTRDVNILHQPLMLHWISKFKEYAISLKCSIIFFFFTKMNMQWRQEVVLSEKREGVQQSLYMINLTEVRDQLRLLFTCYMYYCLRTGPFVWSPRFDTGNALGSVWVTCCRYRAIQITIWSIGSSKTLETSISNASWSITRVRQVVP
jgi:hypothetical protein